MIEYLKYENKVLKIRHFKKHRLLLYNKVKMYLYYNILMFDSFILRSFVLKFVKSSFSVMLECTDRITNDKERRKTQAF